MECKISISNWNYQYFLYITGSGSGWLTSNRVKGKTGSPKTGMIRLTASGASGSGFEGVAHINSSGQIFQCEIINLVKDILDLQVLILTLQSLVIQEEVVEATLVLEHM